jgi:hypothetical protein
MMHEHLAPETSDKQQSIGAVSFRRALPATMVASAAEQQLATSNSAVSHASCNGVSHGMGAVQMRRCPSSSNAAF